MPRYARTCGIPGVENYARFGISPDRMTFYGLRREGAACTATPLFVDVRTATVMDDDCGMRDTGYCRIIPPDFVLARCARRSGILNVKKSARFGISPGRMTFYGFRKAASARAALAIALPSAFQSGPLPASAKVAALRNHALTS